MSLCTDGTVARGVTGVRDEIWAIGSWSCDGPLVRGTLVRGTLPRVPHARDSSLISLHGDDRISNLLRNQESAAFNYYI